MTDSSRQPGRPTTTDFNRLMAQQVAIENFLISITRALQRHAPAFGQLLDEIERAGEREYRLIPVPGTPPEQADQITADFLEKWRQLLRDARLQTSE